LDGQLLADLVPARVTGAELGEVAARGDAGLLEVALGRLVDLARVDLAVGDLDGVVAVRTLGGLDLREDAGAGRDDGDGDQAVVGVPDLGHTELLAEDARDAALDAGGGHGGTHSLISMLTSAGRSRRMSESTAFGVGSTM